MSTPSLRSLAPRWRFVDSGAADGATNMAIDAALMARARLTGTATLRVYAWDRPTLSLGRHERARDRYDPARLQERGVGIVRRPTGGRALLHDHEVTYSVTAPIGTVSLVESYAAVNALLLDALAHLGVSATVAAAGRRPLRPEGAACFAEPGAGELTVGGAKLVGSAQLREEGALLQHGSILLADDQGSIDALRTGEGLGAPPPAARAATLGAILGRDVGYDEVREALADAFARATGGATVGATGASFRNDTEPEAAALRADVDRFASAYGQASWTWRR